MKTTISVVMYDVYVLAIGQLNVSRFDSQCAVTFGQRAVPVLPY